MKKIGNLFFHITCICIVVTFTIYEYYNSCDTLLVRQKYPKFTLNGPHNTTTVKTRDVYDKLIDLDTFSFLKNPQPCKSYPAGFLLLIVVTSNPLNYENRKIIRNTWGKNVEATRTVFMFGESNNATVKKRIDLESKEYGDIVQGTFLDAYRNMTYKHVMGLKWVAHHCTNAKFVLKTDDDLVVNARELRRFLAKEMSPWGARQLIACPVLKHIVAARSGKWTVTLEEYSPTYYPTYCAGWVILYSQDVIIQLLEEAQKTPYFWIDDVHITGVIAEQIGVPRTQLNSLILGRTHERVLRTLGPKYVGQFLFGPPNLSVDRMRGIWRAIPA